MKSVITDGQAIFFFSVTILVLATLSYMGSDNMRLEKENAVTKVELDFCRSGRQPITDAR